MCESPWDTADMIKEYLNVITVISAEFKSQSQVTIVPVCCAHVHACVCKCVCVNICT